MVVVAQLVRASVCGTEGRGFESHHPPNKKGLAFARPFFIKIFTRFLSHIVHQQSLKLRRFL